MKKESFVKQLKEIEKMDFKTADVAVANAIYEAALIFEQLEDAKKISGTGHNIAQQICEYAQAILKQRWNKKCL